MEECGGTGEVEGYDSDVEECKYKKLLLEQALFFCQHSIIQSFMPDDISTFGLDPILPAMATLHSILSRHSNNQETGHAVHLLEYVHAQIPDPSSDLQMSYTDMLILLKAEAVYYEVFSSDNCYADDEQRHAILEKYFASELMGEADSIPKEYTTDSEYELIMHRKTYHYIKQEVLSSEHRRKDFQLRYFLDSDRSLSIREDLVEMVDNYIVEIRKLLPQPQLVLDFWRSELEAAMEGEGKEEEEVATLQEEGDMEGEGNTVQEEGDIEEWATAQEEGDIEEWATAQEEGVMEGEGNAIPEEGGVEATLQDAMEGEGATMQEEGAMEGEESSVEEEEESTEEDLGNMELNTGLTPKIFARRLASVCVERLKFSIRLSPSVRISESKISSGVPQSYARRRLKRKMYQQCIDSNSSSGSDADDGSGNRRNGQLIIRKFRKRDLHVQHSPETSESEPSFSSGSGGSDNESSSSSSCSVQVVSDDEVVEGDHISVSEDSTGSSSAASSCGESCGDGDDGGGSDEDGGTEVMPSEAVVVSFEDTNGAYLLCGPQSEVTEEENLPIDCFSVDWMENPLLDGQEEDCVIENPELDLECDPAMDWEKWETNKVDEQEFSDSILRSTSPSFLKTPNQGPRIQPTGDACKPNPKEMRVSLSTARLKGFLQPNSGASSDAFASASSRRKRVRHLGTTRASNTVSRVSSESSTTSHASRKAVRVSTRIASDLSEELFSGQTCEGVIEGPVSNNMTLSPLTLTTTAGAYTITHRSRSSRFSASKTASPIRTDHQYSTQGLDTAALDTTDPEAGYRSSRGFGGGGGGGGGGAVNVSPSPLSSVDAALINASERTPITTAKQQPPPVVTSPPSATSSHQQPVVNAAVTSSLFPRSSPRFQSQSSPATSLTRSRDKPTLDYQLTASAHPLKRTRGRPPKSITQNSLSVPARTSADFIPVPTEQRRKRGRPRKTHYMNCQS